MIVKFYQYVQQHVDATIFIDFMALLLCLPFLFAVVEFFYRKRNRRSKRQKLYFVTHSNLVLLVYVGVQFFCLPPDKMPLVFALASLAKVVYIAIAYLLKAVRYTEKSAKVCKAQRQEALTIESEESESTEIQAPMEENMEEVVQLEKDIHITQIYKTLESLRRQKLSAGDRLECKKMEEILKLYQMKERLSTTEASLLNDILASLLKMMAKYTI